MQNYKTDLSERLLEFAANIIVLTQSLESTYAGKHIAKQLLRSATSVGANFEEGRAAESRRDFIHKLQLSLKELKETVYWLRLIEKTKSTIVKKDFDLDEILGESEELVKILGKSVITAKAKK